MEMKPHYQEWVLKASDCLAENGFLAYHPSLIISTPDTIHTSVLEPRPVYDEVEAVYMGWAARQLGKLSTIEWLITGFAISDTRVLFSYWDSDGHRSDNLKLQGTRILLAEVTGGCPARDLFTSTKLL